MNTDPNAVAAAVAAAPRRSQVAAAPRRNGSATFLRPQHRVVHNDFLAVSLGSLVAGALTALCYWTYVIL